MVTTIRYDRDEMSLEITGHAGGGEAGHDIICAGISVLEQTLLRTLLDMERKGDGRAKWKHDTPGEAYIHFIPRPWARLKAQQGYEFAMLGLRMMAEQYPENIRIEEENGNGMV